MFATVVRLSKASRKPLTTKRGNKDYYKGTRQAYLPGGHRTGAPGRHVIRGKAKYRLEDEKVRVYVAPPLETILLSPLKPYVSIGVGLSKSQQRAAFGKFTTSHGLTPSHLLQVARERIGSDAVQPRTLTEFPPEINATVAESKDVAPAVVDAAKPVTEQARA
ncbi:hypothetical protein BDZ94DRAFT_1275718 [Collybia nuda]|uniref:Ribosomal protein L27 n=1 Tax=Collybia nuda TaxID=64659 RepID=A0A9P5XRM3_9AGAR|nr:hypothetical protein BDZ94DRAFT_1275718 [Collybia nuda]